MCVCGGGEGRGGEGDTLIFYSCICLADFFRGPTFKNQYFFPWGGGGGGGQMCSVKVIILEV